MAVNGSCWAHCIGGCSEKISREHVVSKALFFSSKVRVSGLPWCREPKTVGLNAVTAKILCTKHNAELGGEVDREAVHLMESLDKAAEISLAAHKEGRVPDRVQVFEVSVPLLERWMLKTLINSTLDLEYVMVVGDTAPSTSLDALVRIAFGQARFVGEAGLYFAFHKGQEMNVGDEYTISPLIRGDRYIVGGAFEFSGLTMLLWLDPASPPRSESLNDIRGRDAVLAFVGLTRDVEINLTSATGTVLTNIRFKR